jgi:hypothetical protein
MNEERFDVTEESAQVSVCTADASGDRLDKFLAERMGISRSQAQRLI